VASEDAGTFLLELGPTEQCAFCLGCMKQPSIMEHPSDTEPTGRPLSRVVVRWTLRGLGVLFVLGIVFLGSNLLIEAKAPLPLFAEADLGPLPGEADNGHHDFVVGARELGAAPRVPLPLLELLDPLSGTPESAWQRLSAHQDALTELARDPSVAKWLALLRRALAKPRFADSCPLDPRASCSSLAVLEAHHLAEAQALALAKADDFAAALGLWAQMERADADLLATSRSLLTHAIAASCLERATHLVRVLLVGLTRTGSTLDRAARASLRDAMASALSPVTREALDPARILRSEYLRDIERIDLVSAPGELVVSEGRLATGLFLPALLFDRGATLELLGQRYERLAKVDPGTAISAAQPRHTDAPLWWLHNATGKRLLDHMAADIAQHLRKGSLARERILGAKQAALAKARELAP
jgi:hypothetical protein